MARLLCFSFGLFQPSLANPALLCFVLRREGYGQAGRASRFPTTEREEKASKGEQRTEKLDARMEKKKSFSIAMVSASTIRTPCPSLSYPAAAAAVGEPHSSAAVEPPREEEGGSRTFSWKEKRDEAEDAEKRERQRRKSLQASPPSSSSSLREAEK